MPRYKMHLIRPPEPDFDKFRSYGKDRYRCWRYNGGDWIEDDGKPDLAFVVAINGWPFAYGAEFASRHKLSHHSQHPNIVAFEAAMGYCAGLYSVANGRHVEPVESRFVTIELDPDWWSHSTVHDQHHARGRALTGGKLI